MLNVINNGNITTVPGIKAAGIHCGIKSRGKDLALIVSDTAATAAGVFTTNKVTAAPVKLSKQLIKTGKTQAVIINSGNANACTGEKGYRDAEETVKLAAKGLNIPSSQILIASTGKIGENLPMQYIKKGISVLTNNLSYDGGKDVSEAILTTDKVTKSIAVEYNMDGKRIVVGAVAKGSGMIYPKMATMLSFITTNISIEKAALQRALKRSVDVTYNMITVDGDTSTNDSVICLANGLAGNRPVSNKKNIEQFVEALNHINSYLARMIVKDGEGATKCIEVSVRGVKSFADAKSIAFSIANSNLVKTAFFGEDPNWGRIVSSAGASSLRSSAYYFERADIWFADCQIVKNGKRVNKLDTLKIKNILKQKDIKLIFDLRAGKAQAAVWTSDLSYEYIRINSEYST